MSLIRGIPASTRGHAKRHSRPRNLTPDDVRAPEPGKQVRLRFALPGRVEKSARGTVLGRWKDHPGIVDVRFGNIKVSVDESILEAL